MDLLDINTDSKVLVVRPKNRHTGINPTRFIVITNSTALKEFKMAGGGNCDLGKGLNGKKLEIRLQRRKYKDRFHCHHPFRLRNRG